MDMLEYWDSVLREPETQQMRFERRLRQERASLFDRLADRCPRDIPLFGSGVWSIECIAFDPRETPDDCPACGGRVSGVAVCLVCSRGAGSQVARPNRSPVENDLRSGTLLGGTQRRR
jgi:hypothetical protein